MHDYQCPGCDRKLSQFIARSVLIHACQDGCGGFWLSDEVLDYFKQPFEPIGCLK